MARNVDKKARGFTPVRNGEIAGTNPAESTYYLCNLLRKQKCLYIYIL